MARQADVVWKRGLPIGTSLRTWTIRGPSRAAWLNPPPSTRPLRSQPAWHRPAICSQYANYMARVWPTHYIHLKVLSSERTMKISQLALLTLLVGTACAIGGLFTTWPVV